MEKDVGSYATRQRQRAMRSARLPALREELNESARVWKVLPSRFPSGSRPSRKAWIEIDHRLLLRPAAVDPEQADGPRPKKRPTAELRRSSVLGRLAHGSDPFALRLYLTMLAVHDLAISNSSPDVFTSIPLIEKGKDARNGKYGLTWATLAVVGEGDHQRRAARMNRALKRLTQEGVVSVQRSGTRLGREVLLGQCIPVATVPPPSGTTAVFLPMSFWAKGWCATLTGNELMSLLMLRSLPELQVFEEIIPGTASWIPETYTTKRPPNLTPVQMIHPNRPGVRIQAIPAGSHYLRPTQRRGVVAARNVREGVFGIYESAYLAVNELREFGLIKLEIAATGPDITEPSLDRRSAGSAAAFSFDLERMESSAAEVIDDVLTENSLPWRQDAEYHPNVIDAIERRERAQERALVEWSLTPPQPES